MAHCFVCVSNCHVVCVICLLHCCQDFCIDDGAVPDNQIIRDWLDLVAQTFSHDSEACIAVHCIAGLGR